MFNEAEIIDVLTEYDSLVVILCGVIFVFCGRRKCSGEIGYFWR